LGLEALFSVKFAFSTLCCCKFSIASRSGFISTKIFWDVELNDFDFLVFGPESVGLPNEIIESFQNLKIPMDSESRSINLANAVSIVAYESLRQEYVK